MFLLPHNRKRGAAGSLGALVRSTGYLQGGYKDTTIRSEVQLYNTTTEVGRIVYDTGYQRSYTPGIAGNLAGYFSTDNLSNYNKFSYITATAVQNAFSIADIPLVSSCDFGTNSMAWLTKNAGDWYRLNTTTDTPVNRGSLAADQSSTTRQAVSMPSCSSFIDTLNGVLHTLNHQTEVVELSASHPNLLAATIQIPCGMSRSETSGHAIGMNGANVKHTYSGSSIQALAQTTAFSYNFGESHSVTTPVAGYMMAGYSDTTGRYGGTQHGLCQKYTFDSETISTLADLVIAQSSGQMMQGF